jgi:hypothetical protein
VGEILIVEQCPNTQEEIYDMTCVPYSSVVGSHMYAMVYTRPNIIHALGVLIRYMLTHGKEHWNLLKRVLRYLCGTKYHAICYQGKPEIDREVNVHGFVNANLARDLDRRRSTNGYVFNMFGGEINWMSKRQTIVALSTT